MRDEAQRMFGTIVSDDKMKVAKPGESASFIGYTLSGFKLVRPTMDWFLSAMCPERSVTDIKITASRLCMYYHLGGCNDELFSRFCREFFELHQMNPQIEFISDDALVWFISNYMDFDCPAVGIKYAQKASLGATTYFRFDL
uniref:RdRp n=1 Tax=viral metagenome TaxID=1070528 RepID=A0A2V0RLS0_9ZZZZ